MFNNVIEGYGVTLKRIQLSDADKILQWRNSDSIREKMLSNEIIDKESHIQWVNRIMVSQHEAHYIVCYKGDELGVVNFRILSCPEKTEAVAEVGLYVANTDFQGSFLSFLPSLSILDYLFEKLEISRIIVRVLKGNEAAIRFNQAQGYEFVTEDRALAYTDWGRDDRLVYMMLTPEQYQSKTEKLKKLAKR